MAQGPPPSEAGSSKSAVYFDNRTHSSRYASGNGAQEVTPTVKQEPPMPPTLEFSKTGSYHPTISSSTPASTEGTLLRSECQDQNISPNAQHGYYSYPPAAWNSPWSAATYPYGASSTYPSYSYLQGKLPATNQLHLAPPTQARLDNESPSPALPSSPQPPYYKHWDEALKAFFNAVGFTQALRGFEADMIVLNPEFEQTKVPTALSKLTEDLSLLGERARETEPHAEPAGKPERTMDERKLDYVHVAKGVEPQTPTSITKSISQFLARNRARNDASNRNEFLVSLAEKRRRLNENGNADSIPSCARTDAKTQNRDIQMKYDIAKNEDGPLRRTMKSQSEPSPSENAKGKGKQVENVGAVTAERYPALAERMVNIETHLAVRYVPSPPRSLLDRLKFIEDHLVHLEKEYPPWAALHFKQPNRGWPPPPRPTPIIVPSHLTSSAPPPTDSAPQPGPAKSDGSEFGSGSAKGKTARGGAARNTKSSLHRAVMERLEVQKAMDEMSGPSQGEEQAGSKS